MIKIIDESKSNAYSPMLWIDGYKFKLPYNAGKNKNMEFIFITERLKNKLLDVFGESCLYFYIDHRQYQYKGDELKFRIYTSSKGNLILDLGDKNMYLFITSSEYRGEMWEYSTTDEKLYAKNKYYGSHSYHEVGFYLK